MWISDPCVKTSALFQIRADLMDRLAEAPADKQIPVSINQVDSLIESELGIQDIPARHQLFRKTTAVSGVFHLFTLVCVLGHKNQYNLKC
ncbi:hypothetical protein [Mucilaginibacter psychrotolerans]|uniref:Uncharacterized protein n=1 Tax=Mucilaginibacter psychrotolerans TaxID=1524096 RepID=A0A4Y8SEG5_9SPHI|nr:hypothetical protein [Mucilaginibacter psychrotolerans]TFF37268.1 hypothetical protein E2R66_12590 [Mucilaginibacter psychrotolerans]